LALHALLEIMIEKELTHDFIQEKSSSENFDFKEIKNYSNLIETFSHFIQEIRAKSCGFEPLAIVPYINNKFISFSCLNAEDFDSKKTLVLDLFEDFFLKNALRQNKNDIIIENDPLNLKRLSEIIESKTETSFLIYFFVNLPNKNFLILGLFINGSENVNTLKNNLKRFKLEIENAIDSLYKTKLMNLNYEMTTPLRQNFDNFEQGFRRVMNFERLEIQILSKSQNLGKLIFPEFPLKSAKIFQKLTPKIYLKKITDLNKETMNIQALMKQEFNFLQFQEICYFHEEEIKETVGFEIENCNLLRNAIFFGAILPNSIEIIFGLMNVSEICEYYDNINSAVQKMSEIHFFHKLQSLETSFKLLESILRKKRKMNLEKTALEILKAFSLKKKSFALISTKLNKLIENKFRRQFFHAISKMEKLKQILKNMIFCQKFTEGFSKSLENRIIMDKFFKNYHYLQEKKISFHQINKILNSAKNRLKYKSFQNLFLNFHYFQNKSNRKENVNGKYFFLEYEEKLQLLLNLPCKIGLIIKNYDGMVFWKNTTESLFFLNMKNVNSIKEKCWECLDDGFMITHLTSLDKETRKLYCYKFDFQKYSIYIEFISTQSLKLEGNFKKIEFFISEHLTNFQNFILKFVMKKASFIFLMK